MNKTKNQSFNVDDIRRLRNELDKIRGKMTGAELMRDISEGAKEGYRILDELKRKKTEEPTASPQVGLEETHAE